MAITFASAGSFNGFGGVTLSNPTSLQFGPDGKLYVSEQNGSINVFTVGTNASGNYIVTAGQELTLANGAGVVKSIMNHNDNGALNPGLGDRQVTGMLVTGTATNPVLYISSSDPRIAQNGEENLDTNSGIVTRVTKVGTNWVAVDILRGLPRSEENHANNGMVLSPDGTKLYLAVGGNTNNGAPSAFFSYTAEYALSGTVLEIDLPALNSLPILTDSDGSQINGAAASRQYIYDLPTLDDPNVPNTTGGAGENAGGLDENGPFGGNDGLNMAILPDNAPLKIYADGFRNHYDLARRADGKLYTVDNGSNSGLGGNPLIVGGEAVNTPVNNGVGDAEPLFLVQDGKYYGHANPARANQNQAWTVYNDNGTPDTTLTVNTVPNISALVPASLKQSASNPTGIPTGFLINPSKFTGNATRLAQSGVRVPHNAANSNSIVELGSSSNGLVEYTANAYGGALNGALLVAQFNNTVTLLNVNNAGTALEPLIDPGLDGLLGTADDTVADADGVYTLITGLSTPLDVTTGPNGSVWVANLGSGIIAAYKPGVAPPTTDIDGDGLLNAVDPFSRDASNGTSVTLSPGQTLVWDFDPNFPNPNRPGPVGFATGLTGVMINGSTDSEAFFNSASTLPGQNIKLDNVKFATAAGGGATVIEYVSNGDAFGAANNGEYLFHTGLKISPTIDNFTIKWSVFNPLLTGAYQQIGGYIGTGDQSNYLKIIATANPGGEIEILLENNNVVVAQTFIQADDLFTVPTGKKIFFELEIDPTAATATPKITYETAAANKVVTGSPISLSNTAVLNAILGNNKVQGQTTGLAVGLYSSNTGQPPAPAGSFQALFDDITITGTGTNPPALYRVNAGGPTIAATDGGPNWVTDIGAPFLLNAGSNGVAEFADVNPGSIVPSTTPGTIFDTERWDAAGGTELQYGFAVTPGNYEVRLYMGNGFDGTALPGQRVFDVALEGQVKPSLNNIDLSARFGNLVGGLISETVQVTDGTLNIQFLHDAIENPLVNGIEIIKLSDPSALNTVNIVATTQASEPSTNGLFTVSLAQVATTNTVVAYSVTGTATAGNDYTTLTGTATIFANQLSANIPINVLDDSATESAESVIVTLTGVTGPAGVALGSTTAATVNIADNDVPTGGNITIQAESITNISGYRLESNSFATGGSMLSLVGGATSETGTATFAFTGATGIYNVVLGTFDENDGAATLSVAKNNQSIGSVLLNQNLGNASPAAATKVEKPVATGISIASGDSFTVTGSENASEHARFDFIRFEPVGSVSNQVSIAATTQASEPSTKGVFTVSLSQAAIADTAVTYSIAGTATAGADYTALSGTVNILANQKTATIDVSVLDDVLIENAENVIVTLTAATGGVVLGAAKTATVNIADNEVSASPIRLEAEAASKVNYRQEAIGVASGGQVLSFVGGASGESGSATFGFNGSAGAYDIVIGTFDENDGIASFTVQLNDNPIPIGSLTLNTDRGSNVANAQTFISPKVALGVNLAPGDTLIVNGFENGSEHARLDFIQLNPVI